REGGGTNVVSLTRRATTPQRVGSRPEEVGKATKVELLRRANEVARGHGGAVKQVSASYGDGRRRILVANSEGLLASDDQTRTMFVVGVVAAGDTGMQTGRRSVGHTMGFELFDRYQVED